MLRIYLPSSTDLKQCSDVPTVNFVDTWTFTTIFRSRHLGPNIWVLANGSKKIWLGINLWNTYWVLGLLPRYNLIFNHLDFWDPDPGTRDLASWGTVYKWRHLHGGEGGLQNDDIWWQGEGGVYEMMTSSIKEAFWSSIQKRSLNKK